MRARTPATIYEWIIYHAGIRARESGQRIRSSLSRAEQSRFHKWNSWVGRVDSGKRNFGTHAILHAARWWFIVPFYPVDFLRRVDNYFFHCNTAFSNTGFRWCMAVSVCAWVYARVYICECAYVCVSVCTCVKEILHKYIGVEVCQWVEQPFSDNLISPEICVIHWYNFAELSIMPIKFWLEKISPYLCN